MPNRFTHLVARAAPDTQADSATRIGALATTPSFRVVFQSGDYQTRRFLGRFREFLGLAGLPEDVLATIELVTAEVCNNITEHAYPDLPGPIVFEAALEPGVLVCVFTDHGHPFPAGTPPETAPDPPATLPEGGFGWYIIRSLTSELIYQRLSRSNRLQLRIPC